MACVHRDLQLCYSPRQQRAPVGCQTQVSFFVFVPFFILTGPSIFVFRACRLRMEGHTGNYSPPFHCITSKFHLLLDYVRAVAYAGGRLFSAGDDKTVSVSAIL